MHYRAFLCVIFVSNGYTREKDKQKRKKIHKLHKTHWWPANANDLKEPIKDQPKQRENEKHNRHNIKERNRVNIVGKALWLSWLVIQKHFLQSRLINYLIRTKINTIEKNDTIREVFAWCLVRERVELKRKGEINQHSPCNHSSEWYSLTKKKRHFWRMELV